MTGTSYGIFAPLLHGVVNLVDETDFDAAADGTASFKINASLVWYTAPTAIRR